MRIAPAVALLVCSGCEALYNPSPSGTISVEQLNEERDNMADRWALRPLPASPANNTPATGARPEQTAAAPTNDQRLLSPVEYVSLGYQRTRRLCGNFFENLARVEQHTEVGRRDLTIIGAASAGLIAAAQASARAIASVAAGFSVADGMISNRQEILLFKPISNQVRRLAFEGMDDIERKNPPGNFYTPSKGDESGRLDDELLAERRFRAEQAVRDHAEACTRPALLDYVAQALTQVSAKAVGDTATIPPEIRTTFAVAGLKIDSLDDAAYALAALQIGRLSAAQRSAMDQRIPDFSAKFLTGEGLSPQGSAALSILEGTARRESDFATAVAKASEALGRTTSPARSTPRLPAVLPPGSLTTYSTGPLRLKLVPRIN